MAYSFSGCSSLLVIDQLDTSRVTNMAFMCYNCGSLQKIESIDVSCVTAMSYAFYGCSKLLFLLIKNIGKSSLSTIDLSSAANWGAGSAENRQSLIDSLITYSLDRAAAGLSASVIRLSSETKALLTDEEIAQITDKGFSIA